MALQIGVDIVMAQIMLYNGLVANPGYFICSAGYFRSMALRGLVFCAGLRDYYFIGTTVLDISITDYHIKLSHCEFINSSSDGHMVEALIQIIRCDECLL